MCHLLVVVSRQAFTGLPCEYILHSPLSQAGICTHLLWDLLQRGALWGKYLPGPVLLGAVRGTLVVSALSAVPLRAEGFHYDVSPHQWRCQLHIPHGVQVLW